MDKFFRRNTEVTDQLLDTFLCLMGANIRTMIYEKTDRLVSFMNVRELDDVTLERLNTSLLKVEKLRQTITNKKEGNNVVATVAMICDCPIHVRHLEEAGIVTLADLVNCDPLQLMDVLDVAEKESCIRHLHLYCWRWFRLDLIVEQALKRHWKKG